jgi:hypothetical protein
VLASAPTAKPSKSDEDTDNDGTSKPSKKPTHKPSKAPSSGDDSSDVEFTLNRVGYDALDFFTGAVAENLKYVVLKDHDAVIEPYVPMSISVLSGEDDYSTGDTDYYKFSACLSSSSKDSDCYEGTAYVSSDSKNEDMTVECSPLDTFDITVTRYDDDDNKIYSTTGSGICLYVRREIRQLTDSDLEDTLDAMYKLWSVSEEDGQDKYGEDYHSSTYFTESHHFNA